MSTPFFSVCIPAYNASKYIGECIKSVINQSFDDYEVIIINDGSTDNTESIVGMYQTLDSRIKLYTQQNKGLFLSRVNALMKANGEFIIWLDSDDYLHMESMQTIYENIQKSDADIVVFNNYNVYENGGVENSKPLYDNMSVWDCSNKVEFVRDFFSRNDLSAVWKKVAKRSLYRYDSVKKLDYFGIKMGEDFIHSYYPIVLSKKIIYIDKSLLFYRVFQESMTAKYDYNINKTFGIIHLLKKNYVSTLKNEITSDEIDDQYLRSMSKALAYIPGYVYNKDEFYRMLREVRNDEELYRIYSERKMQLNLVYKIPYYFLYTGHYKIIYVIKQVFSKLRKRRRTL